MNSPIDPVTASVYLSLEALVANGFSDAELATRMQTTEGRVQRARAAVNTFESRNGAACAALRIANTNR